MSTGLKLKRIATVLLVSSALLCSAIPSAVGATSGLGQRKTAVKKKQQKQPELPPLPSGPTGPLRQQVPLDAIAAVPPQVTYENNQLTIVAPNSTLADILRAVRKQTGADIDVPAAPERVVTHLGPGPARDIIADLLNGSRFNYVLLGSPTDASALTRIVLVAKSGSQEITPNAAPAPNPNFAAQQNPPAEVDTTPDTGEAEATDDNGNAGDDNADQPPAEAADQTQPEQAPGIKTPQQMLQEMQQRQMQMQQQGQPPVPGQAPPGSGMQPHPPQEN